MPRPGDGALPLRDIKLGDVPLPLRRHHCQIATCHFGQQIEPPCLTLDRERIDAALCQRTAGVELAAAFQDRSQAQGELGAVQAAGLAGAGGVLDARAGDPRRPQGRPLQVGGQDVLPRSEEAQIGMGSGRRVQTPRPGKVDQPRAPAMRWRTQRPARPTPQVAQTWKHSNRKGPETRHNVGESSGCDRRSERCEPSPAGHTARRRQTRGFDVAGFGRRPRGAAAVGTAWPQQWAK